MIIPRKQILRIVETKLKLVSCYNANELEETDQIGFDLNLSFTELANLVSELEDYYGIEIDYYDIENFTDIGDIIDFIIDNTKELT
jgi:acyl carrier protein